MSGSQNTIRIGGDVSGAVVAGDHNVVGASPAPAAASAAAPAASAPRIGFVVDIIGFGHRGAEDKEELQRRLDALVGRVIADLGITRKDTTGDVAGDSTVVFLPVGTPSPHAVPRMISAMAERLGRDNQRHRDRMRLRMAVGSGMVGQGPLGFTGELVVDLHRLVDSVVLRQAVRDHEHTDLALLVTHTLHDEVIRPGYLDREDFTEVAVKTKEFEATAWLRLC